MKCLVRHAMDGFHRSLKVETRVRTPLGVHTVEPQVAARFASLTWGFIVSGDHLVVSGSCHAVQPMMGRGPDIVPRLCPPTGPRFDDYPPARPPVARDGVARASRREPVDRVCLRARPCGRCVGMAAGGRSLATRRCAQRSGVAAPLPGSARTSRRSAARGTTTRRPSLMLVTSGCCPFDPDPERPGGGPDDATGPRSTPAPILRRALWGVLLLLLPRRQGRVVRGVDACDEPVDGVTGAWEVVELMHQVGDPLPELGSSFWRDPRRAG